jgi:hypothetical protein
MSDGVGNEHDLEKAEDERNVLQLVSLLERLMCVLIACLLV